MHLDAILEALPFAAGGNSNNFKSSYRQFGGKRVYLYTENSNQLDPVASEQTISLPPENEIFRKTKSESLL